MYLYDDPININTCKTISQLSSEECGCVDWDYYKLYVKYQYLSIITLKLFFCSIFNDIVVIIRIKRKRLITKI